MLEELYRRLYRVRRVEERIAEVYPTDVIQSPIHLSIGQEAISVGVCAALRPQDVVFGTYRGHALYLAKGGDLKKMLAELYGKVTGCAGGKAGSMHLVDMSAGVMGMSAIVGTTIPLAVGHAYADKLRGTDRVSVCFFGDGATEEGVFYESVNFAVLHELPVLFVCENNGYAVHSPISERQATGIMERVRGLGVRLMAHLGFRIGIIQMRGEIQDLLCRMTAMHQGPAFIECETYRWREHVGPNEDYNTGYRSRDELQPWRERDQVTLLAHKFSPLKCMRIAQEIEAEIDEAFAFAEESPLPAARDLYQIGEVPWSAH